MGNNLYYSLWPIWEKPDALGITFWNKSFIVKKDSFISM